MAGNAYLYITKSKSGKLTCHCRTALMIMDDVGRLEYLAELTNEEMVVESMTSKEFEAGGWEDKIDKSEENVFWGIMERAKKRQTK